MTLRIELLKVWLKALNPLFHYESTNRTHFSNMSQGIEPFFKIWLEELNFFWILTQRIELFWVWRKELNLFSWIWRNDWFFLLNFVNKELNFLFKNDSMNWIWLKGLNLFFFFFNLTQRIELFVCFKMWLKELNFWTLLQIWLTLRIQPFWTFSYDSTNWTYFTWLKELNLIELSLELNLLFHDSKNWTLFWRDSMNWIFFVIQRIVLSLFNVIQRIESFLLNVTQRIESLLKNMKNWSFLQIWLRIEPFLNLFIWLEEMNIFWLDSKNWTFFEMIQRIKPFCMWLKELKFLYKKWVQEWIFRMWLKELKFFNMTQRIEYDAHNWTSLFSNMTHRIEHLFSRIWRTDLNISFLEYDAQNWTSLFSNMTHRIEHPIILEYDSQNFFNMTHRFFLTHRTEHLFLQLTHRTEHHLFLQMTQRIDFF